MQKLLCNCKHYIHCIRISWKKTCISMNLHTKKGRRTYDDFTHMLFLLCNFSCACLTVRLSSICSCKKCIETSSDLYACHNVVGSDCGLLKPLPQASQTYFNSAISWLCTSFTQFWSTFLNVNIF